MEKNAPPPYDGPQHHPPNIGFVQPHPPPGYNHGHGGAVTTQPFVGQQTAAVNYGPTPQMTTCGSCHTPVTTRVENEATSRTHLTALLIFCCFCWPCACLPYCMDSCQNQNHYCPACGQFLGAYEH